MELELVVVWRWHIIHIAVVVKLFAQFLRLGYFEQQGVNAQTQLWVMGFKNTIGAGNGGLAEVHKTMSDGLRVLVKNGEGHARNGLKVGAFPNKIQKTLGLEVVEPFRMPMEQLNGMRGDFNRTIPRFKQRCMPPHERPLAF